MDSLILIDFVIVLIDQSVTLVRDVRLLSIFHWHVYIACILSLLHVQWRVRVIKSTSILTTGVSDGRYLASNGFKWPNRLVLGVKHFRNVTLKFFFLRLNVLDGE